MIDGTPEDRHNYVQTAHSHTSRHVSCTLLFPIPDEFNEWRRRAHCKHSWNQSIMLTDMIWRWISHFTDNGISMSETIRSHVDDLQQTGVEWLFLANDLFQS